MTKLTTNLEGTIKALEELINQMEGEKKSLCSKVTQIKKIEELIAVTENCNDTTESDLKYDTIPYNKIPDKAKIKEVKKFFEENKDSLKIEFTKNLFAISLRENLCPKTHTAIDNYNTYYRREQIIYYIISRLTSEFTVERRGIMLSELQKNNNDIYSVYTEIVIQINKGYNEMRKKLNVDNDATNLLKLAGYIQGAKEVINEMVDGNK